MTANTKGNGDEFSSDPEIVPIPETGEMPWSRDPNTDAFLAFSESQFEPEKPHWAWRVFQVGVFIVAVGIVVMCALVFGTLSVMVEATLPW